MSQMPIYLNR